MRDRGARLPLEGDAVDMNLRLELAQLTSALSTGILQRVFHRPAANFPGKIGLHLDPRLISDLRARIREGTVVVVGTNGKTTVTNLLADAFQAAGKDVVCNRTGANLDSGIASALLHSKEADWGVFESDELWLAKILPQLQPEFVVLLNLFRDQLDRVGEIDRTQAAIAEALTSSPATTLVYNVDDPLCHAIAIRVANESIPFGVGESLGLSQNAVSDTNMCQQCDSIMEYDWRQYGQIGSYHCPNCGFRREDPIISANDVSLSPQGTDFSLSRGERCTRMHIPFSETYMLYNALAVFAAADCCGLSPSHVDSAVQSFNPQNGRLQRYGIGGRPILLSLAKNPTGFNQSLRIVQSDPEAKAVAFFINDKEADGHDISWLWDVDFQELSAIDGLFVFAGGIRRNDLQVRLKYAGVNAPLVEGAYDFLAKAGAAVPNGNYYLFANYTALPDVKAELDAMNRFPEPRPFDNESESELPSRARSTDQRLVIMHLYPDLLNLYGDGGNVTVLAERARRRGLAVEVVRVVHGQVADLSEADIVFLGGGPDREQRLASRGLLGQAEAIRDYVEDDGVLLAICGGYQILGREWLLGEECVPGLDILDMTTGRAEGGSRNRLVDNIALDSPLANTPVVGYENHAGRTFLGSACKPFGVVMGKHGKGNNDDDGTDGALYRNVVGTYLHGPLLAKNPEVADYLIRQALVRRAAKEGRAAPTLAPLDDRIEQAANTFMCEKLGLH